jgi:hypothetical protein
MNPAGRWGPPMNFKARPRLPFTGPAFSTWPWFSLPDASRASPRSKE